MKALFEWNSLLISRVILTYIRLIIAEVKLKKHQLHIFNCWY